MSIMRSKNYSLLSENEIDTVLFCIFNIHGSASNSPWHVCLCNPPGGDWSRISMYSETRISLYTWNTLPRVRNENKLPDFVVQTSSVSTGSTYICSIESKDRPKSLEIHIGERMNQFMKWLSVEVPPSLIKNCEGHALEPEELGEGILVSAVATTFHSKDSEKIVSEIWEKCDCNLCINMLKSDGRVYIEVFNNPGRRLSDFEALLKEVLFKARDYADLEVIFKES